MSARQQTWPLIDENQWERQLGLLVANVKFTEGLSSDLHSQSLQQYIDDHPEKMLFTFVMGELLPWLDQCGLPENNERYVMLAAITAVNCITNVPMPPVKKQKNKTTWAGSTVFYGLLTRSVSARRTHLESLR